MTREPGAGMNSVIGNILRYGVIVSAGLVVLGVLLLVARTPPTLPASVAQLVLANYGRPTLDPTVFVSGLGAGDPIFVMELGLLVLLATPVVRVGASVILFAAQGDRVYVAVTLLVLAILLVSVVIVGPAVARAG